MKAPDTIYIPIVEEEGKRLLCTIWWETDARSRYVNETIPYIRKDALLEWANKELKRYSEDTQWEFGYSRALRELIDKLNQL